MLSWLALLWQRLLGCVRLAFEWTANEWVIGYELKGIERCQSKKPSLRSKSVLCHSNTGPHRCGGDPSNELGKPASVPQDSCCCTCSCSCCCYCFQYYSYCQHYVHLLLLLLPSPLRLPFFLPKVRVSRPALTTRSVTTITVTRPVNAQCLPARGLRVGGHTRTTAMSCRCCSISENI